MRQRIYDLLRSVYGYSQFLGHQEEIIEHVIGGGDALVLMPTGGGKSLCYQLPSLVRSGVGVVVTPLISLMRDQVEALLQLNVRAGSLSSAQTPEEAHQVFQRLSAGALDLLYVSPERLLRPDFLDYLHQVPLALFAIDEAHCVSQWGHDFRPDYLGLSVLENHFPMVPRIALTATADVTTRAEILTRLGLGRARIFISSFDRPNIRYTVIAKNNPHLQLRHFLTRKSPKESGIVYRISRNKVALTCDYLLQQGRKALTYHAGMNSKQRQENQDRFLNEEGIIMVATIAFGLGIDKPDVRFVVHLDMPKSLEAYYQETGRAGRDREKAEALLTYGLEDMVMLRKFITESNADETQKRVESAKLESMLNYCEAFSCRRNILLRYFGETGGADCGNCDICLNPAPVWDATLASRKALSCVHRTEQIFGVRHLVNVLRGIESEQVLKHRHHLVSTFGIGKDLSERQWHAVFRHLVVAGYLCKNDHEFAGLKLTHACGPLLRDEQKVFIRQEPEEKFFSSVKKKNNYKRAVEEVFGEGKEDLWDLLRAKRSELSLAQKVPPYVIFHDATLRIMAEKQPRTLEQMMAISGVGKAKLEKYGPVFLRVVEDFIKHHRK
ncbi:MAG: DNA helicase RecQ [Magnetococcus sp. DMHC-6]